MTTVEATPEAPAKTSLLETWGQNERMRHVPSISWMVEKVDVHIRRRIEKILVSFATLNSTDSRHEPLDRALRALCRALDRLADTARPHRGHNHAPTELPSHLTWGVSQAVSALQAIDASLFGRRYPFQTHERSKAEPLYGSLLNVLSRIDQVIPLIRAIDPGFDERLFEGLVVLEEPLREQPIALP